MLYMTGADAAISTWTDKARWLFWRPITAIREAAADGNPDTAADANWLPLINTPGYPDQPSGLSSLSAAMAESLEAVFGHRVRFSVASLTSNTTRSYEARARGRRGWSISRLLRHPLPQGRRGRRRLREDVARDGLKEHFERD